MVSTQTKYRLIYALVYSNFFMRNGLHNFMSIYASQQVNHYKRLGTIEDRRFERKYSNKHFPLCIRYFPCLCYAACFRFASFLFYALHYIIKMETLLLGFFERCAKLKLSEYIVFRVREIKSREFKTERK